jgi:hypothetical protein
MADALEFAEVPYLEEIIRYLPIDAVDKEDVSLYLQNVTNLINVNYKYEQYQFAYFGLHLLYMTYIYFTVWKISKTNPERYKDAVVFARAYSGSELDFLNIESIFDYSRVPEGDLPKIFSIIELDSGQIGIIKGRVNNRNDMAHATGKFEILNYSGFEVNANSICTSMRNIHNSMKAQIKNWYKDLLINYGNGKFGEYVEAEDFINEQMIQGFNLSTNELLVCNEMSIRNTTKENLAIAKKLKSFKRELKLYCENHGYL